jgi:hypothetical protein
LVASDDTHPTDVDHLARWLDDEAAGVLGGKVGWQDDTAGAHRDISVPTENVERAFVVLISFPAPGEVSRFAPALPEDGLAADPEGNVAVRVVHG